jgi:5-dehydro-2-deoxygluconokinase
MRERCFGNNQFLIVGRAGMDLYADPPGTRVEEATHFSSALGGSAANIAAAITRLGGQTSLLTCISDDAIGRYVSAQLKEYQIDGRYVFRQGGQSRNSLAVVETRNEDCQSVIYRNGAADFQLSVSHVEKIDLEPFGALIVTGTCLALEPSRAAVFELLHRAKTAALPVVMDLDYRPYSWASRTEAAAVCNRAAHWTDILVGNNEEFDLLAGGTGAGLNLARRYSQDKIAIHKMGEHGSITFNGDTSFETPVFKVAALKPTGAGDAFLGAFCISFAEGFDLRESVKHGSAAAAIVVTKVGCAPASPTREELSAFLKANS